MLNDERCSGEDVFELGEQLKQCFLGHTEKMNKQNGVNGGGNGHLELCGHSSGQTKPQKRYHGAL